MELIERVIIISLIIFKWKKEKERRENCILYFPLTFTGKRKKLSYSRKIYSYPIRELANSCTPFKSFPNTIPNREQSLNDKKNFFRLAFAHTRITCLPSFQIQDHVYTFSLSDFIHPRTKLVEWCSFLWGGGPTRRKPGTINVIVNNYDARRGVNGGLFESCNGILDCFKSFLVGEVDFERIMLLFGE